MEISYKTKQLIELYEKTFEKQNEHVPMYEMSSLYNQEQIDEIITKAIKTKKPIKLELNEEDIY